jgi:hypothetical protein
MKRFALTALFLAALVGLSGCGNPSTPKLHPVSGKITVGGSPLAAGNVSLMVSSKTDEKIGMVTGQVTNGEYKVFTQGKEGAPEGKYKVTVTPSMVPTGGSKMPVADFDPKYSDYKKTNLTLDVPSGNYDLKLDKKK